MHKDTLLIIIFYVTPFAAILLHTLTERLLVYQETYFFDLKPLHKRLSFAAPLSNLSFGVLGSIASYTQRNMSTRYWDEIDWYIKEATEEFYKKCKGDEEDSGFEWSTGEPEQPAEIKFDNAVDEAIDQMKNVSVMDEILDGGSEKDDDNHRSASVEDESSNVIKKHTKVEDLQTACANASMMPPIYTYYATDDEKFICTVQLWNGERFSSLPQKTKDEAMEDAADRGLQYLKKLRKENRPISTSPPSTTPQYVTYPNVVSTHYHHFNAYGAPITYTAAQPRPHFYPSNPYTFLPQGHFISVPPEFRHPTHYRPSYRIPPHYAPYLPQFPCTPAPVSPTHHAKHLSLHQVGFGPQPILWNLYPKDGYLVTDKAHAPKTEFKLLDKPPVLDSNMKKETSEDQKLNEETESTSKNSDDKKETSGTSSTAKQSHSKAKLAISFKQSRD